jgi:hypothetical protein
VPRDVAAKLGRDTISRSLRTSSYREAVGQARRVAAEFEHLFIQARHGVVTPIPVRGEQAAAPSVEMAAPAMPSGNHESATAHAGLDAGSRPPAIDLDTIARLVAHKLAERAAASDIDKDSPMAEPPKQAQGLTIRELYQRYLSDPAAARSGKTLVAYRTIYTRLIELLGADIPVTAITREACRKALDTLRHLPPNSPARPGAS